MDKINIAVDNKKSAVAWKTADKDNKRKKNYGIYIKRDYLRRESKTIAKSF